jgi:predicted outer membrane protein
MRAWLISVISICALLAGCGPRATSPAQPPAIPSQNVTQPNLDARFLAAAAMYENYQIRSAEIAAAQGQSQAVKTYAADAATVHRAALQSLTQAARTNGMPAPGAELNEDYRAYLDRLGASDSTPFDVRYISEQTLTTMSMAGRYDAFTSTAPDSELKRWAASRSQSVHDEINTARQLARDAIAR